MISFHVPEDKNLLAALGVLTLRHEHMSHILKMTFKSLAKLTPEEALHALRFEGARSLRQRINKIAKRELGEGTPLLKLQAILGRAGKLTDQRNNYVHGIWAKELDGNAGILDVPGEMTPLPTIENLENLGKDI